MTARRTYNYCTVSRRHSGAERRRKNIHIRALNASHGDGEPLQLSSRQLVDLSAQDLVQLQTVAESLFVVEFDLGVEHVADCHNTLDRTGNVVDVLRLD